MGLPQGRADTIADASEQPHRGTAASSLADTRLSSPTGQAKRHLSRWGGQPLTLHGLQRLHHQVRRAFAPRRLLLQHHLPGDFALQPFVGQCWTGDVAAQSFQHWRPSVSQRTEARRLIPRVLALMFCEARLPRHGPIQRKHLLARAGQKATRRCAQLRAGPAPRAVRGCSSLEDPSDRARRPARRRCSDPA